MPLKVINDYVRGSGTFKFGGGANSVDLYDTDANKFYIIYLGGGDDLINILDPQVLGGAGVTGNLIDGGKGDDKIYCSNNTNDTLIGGLGADWIEGGLGDDIIYGANSDNPYDDTSTGANYLYGDAQGIDSRFGVGGSDTIYASTGKDFMWGGPGADIFVIPKRTGDDRIIDFSGTKGLQDDLAGQGDKLDLKAYGISGNTQTWFDSNYSPDTGELILASGTPDAGRIIVIGLTLADIIFS